MEKESLLDKAKNFNDFRKARKTITTKEKVEVVISFMYKEITFSQLGYVLSEAVNPLNRSINYGVLTKMLRDGISNGWIDIKLKK